MTDYAQEAINVAADLANEGQQVTLSYVSGGTKNAATGVTSGGTPQTFTASAVATSFDNNEIDGEIIQRNDLKLIMDAISGEPAQNHKCTVDGVDYRVMNHSAVSPAGIPVIYKVQLRV